MVPCFQGPSIFLQKQPRHLGKGEAQPTLQSRAGTIHDGPLLGTSTLALVLLETEHPAHPPGARHSEYRIFLNSPNTFLREVVVSPFYR